MPNPSQPDRRASVAPSALFLVLILWVVYNVNFRWIHTADSIPSRLLPFSLLIDHSLYLDRWVEPYLPADGHPAYYIAKSHEHSMSRYPLILPVIITPLYVAPAWWVSRHNLVLPINGFIMYAVINTMEKLSASLVAALSAGLLYLALKKTAPPRWSIAIAGIYGLASTTWAISSQALWRHGLTELAFALMLWGLVRSPASGNYGLWVGLALAIAAANKPADAVFALVFLVYFARLHRRHFPGFCAPLLLIGLAVIGYNFYFFHRLLGAYPEPLPVTVVGRAGASPMVRFPWWDGALGLLVSPNRGLFIFIPWTLLAVWGGARLWRENTFDWCRYLIVGMLVMYAGHARLGLWWGGTCYGPRYLTDLLPFLAFFLVPVWPRIQASRLGRAALVITVAAALWIEIVGVFYYPSGDWDGTPVNVNYSSGRLWDWSDTEIGRSWNAGPAHPQMLYDWFTLIKSGELSRAGLHSGTSQNPTRRQSLRLESDSRRGSELPGRRNDPGSVRRSIEPGEASFGSGHRGMRALKSGLFCMRS